jgi:O-antigen/teichoic acid export membrane protein
VSATVDIDRRVAQGTAWMVALRMVIRLLSVVSQLILVRLLTQEDFGLVAGAGTIYAMLDMLGELSLTWALVQMAAPERHHYDTAFTLVMLRGLAIGLVLWTAAPFMADFLHDTRVQGIVDVLAVSAVVQGFESMGLITLQRELRFKRIVAYRMVGRLVGFSITISLAFIFRDYWALVIGNFVARILTIPLSYAVSPYRPGFSLRAVRELFNFSKWLFFNNMLTMLDNSMMAMTLGRLGGVRDIGLYQVSADFAALPASEIAAPARAPMYAGYARVADDLAALRAQVVSGMGFLAMLIVPMAVGIAVTAWDMVPIVLGPNWTDAAPVLALCAFYSLFDALGHFTGNVYIVRGAQRPYVAVMAACLALRLAVVIPAAAWGGVVPAVGMLALTALLNAAVWFAGMRKLIAASWQQFAAATWRSFAAALLMAAAVMALQAVWTLPATIGPMLVHWAVLCGFGAAVHIGAQALLWRLCGLPSGPEASFFLRLRGTWTALLTRLAR